LAPHAPVHVGRGLKLENRLTNEAKIRGWAAPPRHHVAWSTTLGTHVSLAIKHKVESTCVHACRGRTASQQYVISPAYRPQQGTTAGTVVPVTSTCKKTKIIINVELCIQPKLEKIMPVNK